MTIKQTLVKVAGLKSGVAHRTFHDQGHTLEYLLLCLADRKFIVKNQIYKIQLDKEKNQVLVWRKAQIMNPNYPDMAVWYERYIED